MHVEVCLKESSGNPKVSELRQRVLHILEQKHVQQKPLVEGQLLDFGADPALSAHVQHIFLRDPPQGPAPPSATATVHVHRLYDEEVAEETAGADADEDGSVAFQMFLLPAREFDGLWETLLYENDIKERLLRYVGTAMRFSEMGIDSRIISWNRVVLLHGPPGTGKTSLCKALAQKVAIRLSHVYQQGHLIEINAHSLFSKWFSESGKMVLGMFSKIREILEDDDAFVCVLIDEVESLTAARKAAISGNEPSDAVRVVNALLTQLDGLKRHAADLPPPNSPPHSPSRISYASASDVPPARTPRYKNALVVTTSNLTGAIDAAFVDRADIKQYIGPPGVGARYDILTSCLVELRRAGVLASFEELLPHTALLPLLPHPPPTFELLQARPPTFPFATHLPRHPFTFPRPSLPSIHHILPFVAGPHRLVSGLAGAAPRVDAPLGISAEPAL